MTNLIHEPWIPIIRRDGSKEIIRPDQIATLYDSNPVTDVDSPRADFNGAIIQFLIGLMQTAFPPEKERDWRRFFAEPPPEEALKDAFSQFTDVFSLDGDGPRFMQDPSAMEGKDLIPIRNMIIEIPAGRDFFVKRRTINRICKNCAAQALLSFQLNGPASGRGHMTGIRGSGPLTSIIKGDTLWESVFLNVLPTQTHLKFISQKTQEKGLIFPWFGTVRSQDLHRSTTINDGHDLQIFWGMGNRFFLKIENEKTQCDLCGEHVDSSISEYYRRPYGIAYDNTWAFHPLTPYWIGKESPIPMKAKRESFHYQYYPNIAQVINKKESSHPATVVLHVQDQAKGDPANFSKTRLWFFGYEMDNAKAICWNETIIPLFLHDSEEEKERFEKQALLLVNTAEHICDKIVQAVKMAWYEKQNKSQLMKKSDDEVQTKQKKEPTDLRERFWKESEDLFFGSLDRISVSLKDLKKINKIKEDWLNKVRENALNLFDQYAQVQLLVDIDKIQRVVEARASLLQDLSKKDKKIQKLLDLISIDKEDSCL